MSERITQTQFIIAEALNNKGPLTIAEIIGVTSGRKQNVQDTLFRLSKRGYVRLSSDGLYHLTRLGKHSILMSRAAKIVQKKRSNEQTSELPLWVKNHEPETLYVSAPTIDRDEPVPELTEDFFERLFEPTTGASLGVVLDIQDQRIFVDIDQARDLYRSLRELVGPHGSLTDK